jgi:hypothetical protein
MDAIDHLDLVVGSLERSLPFYRDLLVNLGYVHAGGISGERGERVVYLSRHQDGGGALDWCAMQGTAQSIGTAAIEVAAHSRDSAA